MVARFLHWLGAQTPDGAVESIITGLVAAPGVALFGSDGETALLVLFVCAFLMAAMFLQACSLEFARQAEEEDDPRRRRVQKRAPPRDD